VWTPAEQQRASENSLFVAMASLITALVALVLAYQAWTRPYPADPTQIPSWGDAAEPRMVSDAGQAQAFFDFLTEHAGRKVRIYLDLNPDYFGGPEGGGPYWPREDGFVAPPTQCPGDPPDDVTEFEPSPECPYPTLYIRGVGEGRLGLFPQDGIWHLRGYFANVGFQRTGMGQSTYAVTPMTDIEAVS
jgi:hypothetical protein